MYARYVRIYPTNNQDALCMRASVIVVSDCKDTAPPKEWNWNTCQKQVEQNNCGMPFLTGTPRELCHQSCRLCTGITAPRIEEWLNDEYDNPVWVGSGHGGQVYPIPRSSLHTVSFNATQLRKGSHSVRVGAPQLNASSATPALPRGPYVLELQWGHTDAAGALATATYCHGCPAKLSFMAPSQGCLALTLVLDYHYHHWRRHYRCHCCSDCV